MLASFLKVRPLRSFCTTDDTFGPPVGCRFDFTLLFEESILFIGPSVLFLILSGLRIWQLRKERRKVRHATLQVLKVVRRVFMLFILC